MEKLLSMLHNLKEYEDLNKNVSSGKCCAVTGVSQICRSHLIAGLFSHTSAPITVICQDDMTAKRLQEDMTAFLGITPPVLCSRELTLYDSAVVSRAWEQKRLRQLYDLAQGTTRLQIMTWDALSQRTVPPKTLSTAAFTLNVGQSYIFDDLLKKLTNCGYSHCGMVEGPGQFAVRGGILDIYSPAADRPVRMEFFGDELDTMGFFDPVSQRRTENTDFFTVLPVGETQPKLHEQGLEGLCQDLRRLIATQRRRKNINEALIATLEKDLNKYENDLSNPASDRYMGFIYPEFTTALDYVPSNSIVVLCDQASLHRSAKTRVEDMGLQLDSMLQAGLLAGELCDYVCQWEDFCRQLSDKAVVYMDTFAGAAYPEECPPKSLIPISARQLPGYGGSLDTAVSDLSHYVHLDFSCLVLCGSRHRAELLQEMLFAKNVKASIAIPLTQMPAPGQIYLSEGILPFGMEYPDLKLAVLSEGQLLAKTNAPKKGKKAATNRQKLSSFTDLTPGDLVVHENYGIGRFVAMEQIRVDGAVKDYVKIAYQGSDTLFVPATQLDMVSKYIGSGGEDGNVRLNKIGTDAWQKTKAKARKAAKDMAGELIQLYAARKRQEGFALLPIRLGNGNLKIISPTQKLTISFVVLPRSRGIWKPPFPWIVCFAAM